LDNRFFRLLYFWHYCIFVLGAINIIFDRGGNVNFRLCLSNFSLFECFFSKLVSYKAGLENIESFLDFKFLRVLRRLGVRELLGGVVELLVRCFRVFTVFVSDA